MKFASGSLSLFFVILGVSSQLPSSTNGFTVLRPCSNTIGSRAVPKHDHGLSRNPSSSSLWQESTAIPFFAANTQNNDANTKVTTINEEKKPTPTPIPIIEFTSPPMETNIDFSMIESIPIETLTTTTTTSTTTNEKIALGDAVKNVLDDEDEPFVLSCLSHFGDFNAWELTQQYIAASKSNRLTTKVVLVGIGSVESAKQFATDLGLNDNDDIVLLADENGAVSDALGCYKGWLAVDQEHKERYPHTDVNPYIKLFGMIFGLGSPGTIPKVVEGYTGDWNNDQGADGRTWVVDSLLQGSEQGRFPKLTNVAFAGIPKDSPLRPFELATLRLQTGLHIVSKWSKLGPQNGDLFTRMGGTFVFSSPKSTSDGDGDTAAATTKPCIWNVFDQGILNFANVDDVCMVADAAEKGKTYVPFSKSSEQKEARSVWKEQRVVALQAAEAKRKADEEAKLKAAAEAKLKAEEEARLKAEEEARIKEEARVKAEEEARIKAEEEARVKAEEEARVRAEEEARIKAEEEARIKAEEEALVKAEEEARLKAEEEARMRAEEEARMKAEEEARIKAEEEAKLKAEDEARLQAEEEARLKALEEERLAKEKALEQEAEQAKVVANPEKEAFQRRLLEAQLLYSSKPSVDSKPAVTETAMTEAPAVVSANDDKEAFQRTLLEAQLLYSGKALQVDVDKVKEIANDASIDEKEAFQRRLLEARIKYQS